ncbi:15569_t:CDS:2, partial [Gigaspora margarita]
VDSKSTHALEKLKAYSNIKIITEVSGSFGLSIAGSEKKYLDKVKLSIMMLKIKENGGKLHSDDIINKRKLITHENSPTLNMNRTPSKH